MPDSVAALRRLGVELDVSAGYPFKGIRFSDGSSTVTGDFPNGSGLGVRRFHLHELLVKHAQAAGVNLIWGAKNVRLCDGGISMQGEALLARPSRNIGESAQVTKQSSCGLDILNKPHSSVRLF